LNSPLPIGEARRESGQKQSSCYLREDQLRLFGKRRKLLELAWGPIRRIGLLTPLFWVRRFSPEAHLEAVFPLPRHDFSLCSFLVGIP